MIMKWEKPFLRYNYGIGDCCLPKPDTFIFTTHVATRPCPVEKLQTTQCQKSQEHGDEKQGVV